MIYTYLVYYNYFAEKMWTVLA